MTDLTRRELLQLGGAAVTAAAANGLPRPGVASAQTPKRGGVFRMAGNDPPHFDPHQTTAWWTFIHLSFTHSRLVKVKAGPSVPPGTVEIEPDLAESWSQPNDTTWVFQLRRGVRWHPKPPLNGRELTAEDVKYTYERAMTVKGNPNRSSIHEIERVEAVDRYTVRFTTREPYAWFLDGTAQLVIVPREAVEQFGDLKRPASMIGTGPWMLERYEANVRAVYVRNPHYFVSGLPYADGVNIAMDPDPASRFAGWMSGRYDFGSEIGMVVRRIDREVARRRKPDLQTAEYIWLVSTFAIVKLDQEPFRDVRVRRAMAMAGDPQEMLEVNPAALGHGAPNPAIPAALRDWSIPIDQLPPDGQKIYRQDLAAGVDDPRLTEMIKLQRRTFDVVKRRQIVYDIQRYLSQQVYYIYTSPSARVVGAWEPYVKNFMPNIGNDYGGHLMAAWLDR